MPRAGWWEVELRGGAYDGWTAEINADPPPILVVWRCNDRCGGHMTDDAHDPDIVLRTAESYKRTEVKADKRLAIYEIGEHPSGPEVEDDTRELVGAGAGAPDVIGALRR